MRQRRRAVAARAHASKSCICFVYPAWCAQVDASPLPPLLPASTHSSLHFGISMQPNFLCMRNFWSHSFQPAHLALGVPFENTTFIFMLRVLFVKQYLQNDLNIASLLFSDFFILSCNCYVSIFLCKRHNHS